MLEFHHIGVLVDDIDQAAHHYQGLFGDRPLDGPYHITSQGVRVAFVAMDHGHLELVQEADETSILASLRKRKVKYYHVGYMTNELDNTIEELVGQRDFRLLSTFESEAFSMRRCAFLFSPELHLIELIGKT